jgi:hypothetical protein
MEPAFLRFNVTPKPSPKKKEKDDQPAHEGHEGEIKAPLEAKAAEKALENDRTAKVEAVEEKAVMPTAEAKAEPATPTPKKKAKQ